jgi:hypothetical protein
MHIGQARHEKLAPAINLFCILWETRRSRRAHRFDPSILGNYGLMFNNALAVHWHDGDIDKHNWPLLTL